MKKKIKKNGEKIKRESMTGHCCQLLLMLVVVSLLFLILGTCHVPSLSCYREAGNK